MREREGKQKASISLYKQKVHSSYAQVKYYLQFTSGEDHERFTDGSEKLVIQSVNHLSITAEVCVCVCMGVCMLMRRRLYRSVK